MVALLLVAIWLIATMGLDRAAPSWSAMATATTCSSSATPRPGSGSSTNRPTGWPRLRTGELDPLGRRAPSRREPSRRAPRTPVDRAAAFEPRQGGAERRRLEPALSKVEQLGELCLGHERCTSADVRRPGPPARRPGGCGGSRCGRGGHRAARAGAHGELADHEPDDQEQHRRLDVVGRVDAQRQVRRRVEEVERHERRPPQPSRPPVSRRPWRRRPRRRPATRATLALLISSRIADQRAGDRDGTEAADHQPDEGLIAFLPHMTRCTTASNRNAGGVQRP